MLCITQPTLVKDLTPGDLVHLHGRVFRIVKIDITTAEVSLRADGGETYPVNIGKDASLNKVIAAPTAIPQ